MSEKRMIRLSMAELARRAANGEIPRPTKASVPPPKLPKDFWKDAVVAIPKRAPKTLLSLRLDPDVVAWFRSQGEGYQSRMNAVLRAYMEAYNPRQTRSKG